MLTPICFTFITPPTYLVVAPLCFKIKKKGKKEKINK